MKKNSVRRFIGAIVNDVPRTAACLLQRGDWVRITNRRQVVDVRELPLSIRCVGTETSSLHVCDVFPMTGRAILRAVMRDWTFELPADARFSDEPEFSFVIPHRGTEREAQLHAVIRSISSLPVPVECIVVEQDVEAKLSELPGNARYLHVPGQDGSNVWNKCLAMNSGAEIARGRVLVFHDGDILVPTQYGTELARLFGDGSIEVAFPQRFLFYLRQDFTARLLADSQPSMLRRAVPEQVRQNWVGGTAAIRRDAFHKIGGYDTRFTGWTGEDREFHDRCQLLQGWFHGFVPFLHLWHVPQAGKVNPSARECNDAFVSDVMSEPRQQRANRLRATRKAT